MKKSWQDLESEVRTVASMTWQTAFQSQLMHGRQIDAYAQLNASHAVAIEVTERKDINKVQEDINKLIHVRNANFQNRFVSTECFCVTLYEPTLAMRKVGNDINISVISIDEFIPLPAD